MSQEQILKYLKKNEGIAYSCSYLTGWVGLNKSIYVEIKKLVKEGLINSRTIDDDVDIRLNYRVYWYGKYKRRWDKPPENDIRTKKEI